MQNGSKSRRAKTRNRQKLSFQELKQMKGAEIKFPHLFVCQGFGVF
jgi:hypothetical protein